MPFAKFVQHFSEGHRLTTQIGRLNALDCASVWTPSHLIMHPILLALMKAVYPFHECGLCEFRFLLQRFLQPVKARPLLSVGLESLGGWIISGCPEPSTLKLFQLAQRWRPQYPREKIGFSEQSIFSCAMLATHILTDEMCTQYTCRAILGSISIRTDNNSPYVAHLADRQ